MSLKDAGRNRGAEQAAKPFERRVALLVLILFCVQLSRFYLVIGLDQFICLEANRATQAGFFSGHDHHDHGSLAPSNQSDKGYYLQHCKDTYEGIALTPVQPLDVPVEISYLTPADNWTIVQVQQEQPVESFLPPPSAPPRNLS